MEFQCSAEKNKMKQKRAIIEWKDYCKQKWNDVTNFSECHSLINGHPTKRECKTFIDVSCRHACGISCLDEIGRSWREGESKRT